MKRRLALAQRTLEVHRERLRIARDMHDEMGARLTYIALLADRTGRENEVSPKERAGLLETLAANARSAVDALDTIVWAVNPQHDTVAGVADYLSDYAPSYLKAAGIQCSLDICLAEPKQALPLLARHELLMAVKEALQNVVKHAAASQVRLAFRQERHTLQISVRDDGRGESAKPGGNCHHGLVNMRQRLAEIGGQCEIRSSDGSAGTCVCFTLPLDAPS
jgi:signal transduction histidine kinase